MSLRGIETIQWGDIESAVYDGIKEADCANYYELVEYGIAKQIAPYHVACNKVSIDIYFSTHKAYSGK